LKTSLLKCRTSLKAENFERKIAKKYGEKLRKKLKKVPKKAERLTGIIAKKREFYAKTEREKLLSRNFPTYKVRIKW
jgi:hypothetical protein